MGCCSTTEMQQPQNNQNQAHAFKKESNVKRNQYEVEGINVIQKEAIPLKRNNCYLIDNNYSKYEFPNHLGCFGIIQTEFTSTQNWDLKKDKPFYCTVRQHRSDISGLASFLRYIESINEDQISCGSIQDYISIQCAYSPPHAITLDTKSRKLANIPQNASKFAWFYPADGIPIDVLENHPNKKLVQKWRKNATVMSLIVGGFSYFSFDNKLLLENTLVPNSEYGLKFGRPLKWRHEFSSKLIEQERFHKITFSHMINTGALYFGWIFPFEELFDNDANSWVVSKYGAFVYLWHEPNQLYDQTNWESDRYFEVIPSDTNVNIIAQKQQTNQKITVC